MLHSFIVYGEVDIQVPLEPEQETDLFLALKSKGINAESVQTYESIWRHLGDFIETRVELVNGEFILCRAEWEKNFECEGTQSD